MGHRRTARIRGTLQDRAAEVLGRRRVAWRASQNQARLLELHVASLLPRTPSVPQEITALNPLADPLSFFVFLSLGTPVSNMALPNS